MFFNQGFNPTRAFTLHFIILLLLALFQVSGAQTTEKLMQKADGYFNEGKYEKAGGYYLKILEEDNYSFMANLQYARCLSLIEKYSEADTYYSKALLNTAETNPLLFLEYGDCYTWLWRNKIK